MKKLTLTFTLLSAISLSYSQNVGINTDGSAPGMMLHVKVPSGNDGIRIQNNSGTGDGIINFQDAAASAWTIGFDADNANRFVFDNGAALTTTNVMVLETTGDVGIGINNPTAQLTVNQDATFNESGGSHDFRIESLNQGNLFFVDGSTDRIGIGTNTPARAFDMIMADAVDYIASVENTNAGSSFMAYLNTSTSNALGGVTNANAGIGGYSVILDAGAGVTTGAAHWGTSNDSDDYGVYGSIPTTGSWAGYGGVFQGGLGYVNGLYNLSDERVKTEIEAIKNPMSILNEINGVFYNYNLEDYGYLLSNDTRRYSGFLAQEVGAVLPEAVAQKNLPVSGPEVRGKSADMSQIEFEQFNVVDYTAIIPVLVEAVKEQSKYIELLEQRIKELEAK